MTLMVKDARDSLAEGGVKVALTGPHGDVETLWAEPLGRRRCRLRNIPFYAYGVSLEDVVKIRRDRQGMLWFRSVLLASGNKTVRVIFETEKLDAPGYEPLLSRLDEMGCQHEGAFGRLLAVNVPPERPLSEVTDLLTSWGLQWEYTNPTYEDLFPDDPV